MGKKKIAGALRAAGATVEVHDDHFPPDAADETWLRAVGQKGWVVLTKDRNIRYRTREARALSTYGVRAFVLTTGNLSGDEMAAVFQAALAKILRLLSKHRRAFMATITQAGRIRLVYPRK